MKHFTFNFRWLLMGLLLCLGSSAWATSYKLEKVTSVAAGEKYVFEQEGHVMNNSVASSALQTTATYNTTGLTGNETYIWTLETATDGFYIKNVSLNSNQYINNASSTNVTFGSKSSIWTITFTNDVALIQNKSNSNRFLGYTNSTSYAYKAYATSNLSSYDHDIIVYKLVEEVSAFEITAQSNTTSYGTVSILGFNITAAPNDGYRVSTSTPYSVSPTNSATVVQNGNTFTVTPTANTTVTINFEAIPTHTATFSVNGTTTSDTYAEGAAITFPTNPADTEGKTFVGWTTEAISGTTDTAPTFVTSATMGNSDVTYYAVFATGTIITDVLDNDLTGIGDTNTYGSWSGKQDKSSAVYAGQSAGNDETIQLRSNNNNSGIITTSSGGKVTKVVVNWNSGTSAGRTLDIYGKNTAYSSPEDLYNSSKQGTLLGSIVKGTSTELTITDDYAYIGMRSNNGAMYMDNVSITWAGSFSDYCTTVVPDTKASITLPNGYTYEMDAKAGGGELPLACENLATDPQLAVVFCDANGDAVADDTYDWITATINANGNIYGQIVANTGATRTAYFKVCGKDADGNDVYSNLVTFTQKGPSIEIKPNSWDAAVGGESKTFNIDDSGLTNPTFAVAFYESDGTTAATYDHSWVTTNVTNEGKLDVTVAANTGAARTAYLKVYAGSVYSDLLTINQAAAPIVYSNIPDLFAAATSTEQDVTVTFNNWVVSGVSTNGKNVFVTDNNGNGFVIYSGTDMSGTYSAGKILSGTISCQLQLYNGFAELLNVGGLTISDGGAVTAVSIDMASLAGMNTGALVSYNNLTCSVSSGKYYLSDGTTTLQVYNSLYAFGSLEDGKQYNITGVYQQYNTTKEILPRSAADIVEVVVTTPTINTTPSSLTGFTYEAGNGPSAAQTINISGSNLTTGWSAYLDGNDNSNFELSFTDDADYFSDAGIGANPTDPNQSLTFYVRMKGGLAVGDYSGSLIITSKGAEPVTVPLSGSVTTPVGAPVWSALPTTPDTDITVGEEYVLDLNSYVTGDPTPTISIITGGDIAEVVSNVFHFTPTSAGSYDFTFKAENSKGSETADFSVWADAPVASIGVSETTINVAADQTTGYVENPVTYNNFTPVNLYVQFFDADENPLTSNPNTWMLAGTSGTDTYFYKINEENTSSEPRKAYFKVVAKDDTNNFVYSDLITVTQAGTTVDYATLPFSWAGGTSAALTALDGVTASGLGSDYSDTHDPYNVKFDDDDDYIQIKTNEQPCKVTLGVKMIGGGKTSTITIQGSADGVTFTDVQALTISGKQNAILTLETSNDFAATDRYVRLLFTKGANVGVGPISITKVQPSITISSGYDYDVNADGGDKELPVVCKYMASDPQLDIEFYESDGTTAATYSWITAKINASGNIDGHIDENTGAERTAYFKVVGLDADANLVYSDLITITQQAPVPPSITMNESSIDIIAGGDNRTLGFSYSNFGGGSNPTFEVRFFEDDTSDQQTTCNWINTEVTTDFKVNISVAANTDDAARTAYLRVYGEYGSKNALSDVVVINQAEYVHVTTYTLANSITSGKHYIITNGSNVAMGSQNSNNRAAVSVTYDNGVVSVADNATDKPVEFVIYGPDASGNYTIYDADQGYLYAASSSSNYLKSQATNDMNGKWSISIDDKDGEATVVAQGSNTRKYMRFNSTLFSCYAETSSVTDLVYFYEKDGEATPTVDVKFAASGYATYCSPQALDLTPTEDYAAWVVTATSGTTVTFTKITGAVPAETPFILYGQNFGGQTANIPTANSNAVTAVADNKLKGTLEETYVATVEGDYTNFGLSNGSFVKIQSGNIKANKAYLPILTSSLNNAVKLNIVFEDETTGISTMETITMDGDAWYDLMGRKVAQPTKGIFIHNGKKVFIK